MTADPTRSLGDAVGSFRKDVEEILTYCDDAHIKAHMRGTSSPLNHPSMKRMLEEELSKRERGALWTAEEVFLADSGWRIEVTETRTGASTVVARHFLGVASALKFAVETVSGKNVKKVGVVKGATVFQVVE